LVSGVLGGTRRWEIFFLLMPPGMDCLMFRRKNNANTGFAYKRSTIFTVRYMHVLGGAGHCTVRYVPLKKWFHMV
jgi:hypothetical protein